MDEWLGAVAIGVPVLQVGMMGTIGYPLARARPDGMRWFRRSGFLWWTLALLTVIALALAAAPELLAPAVPSRADLAALRFGVAVVVALAGVSAIEVVAEASLRRSDTAAARATRQRYEDALPGWAGTTGGKLLLVAGVSTMEDAVYRGVGLAVVVGLWGVSRPVAAVLVAVAFGLGHSYFGLRQVALKALVGLVLCAAALWAGWAASATSHVLSNVVLALAARRTWSR